MTLQELLDLGILSDHVEIRVFKLNYIGLGDYIYSFTLPKHFGVVKTEDLLNNGFDAQYLSYPLIEICGTPDKFKTLLVVNEELGRKE